MSNISFSDKKKKIAASTETIVVITPEKCLEAVTLLINKCTEIINLTNVVITPEKCLEAVKCTEIINLTNNLYLLKTDKNISDALVTLELSKGSLELININ